MTFPDGDAIATGVCVQFLGSGDAFGSGGRFQTCLLLRGAGRLFLIDCGASSLIAMKRAGVSPREIGCVVLSGDPVLWFSRRDDRQQGAAITTRNDTDQIQRR